MSTEEVGTVLWHCGTETGHVVIVERPDRADAAPVSVFVPGPHAVHGEQPDGLGGWLVSVTWRHVVDSSRGRRGAWIARGDRPCPPECEGAEPEQERLDPPRAVLRVVRDVA